MQGAVYNGRAMTYNYINSRSYSTGTGHKGPLAHFAAELNKKFFH
jgi:hypothetical protein